MKEKKAVALMSIFAAVLITSFKVIVGVLTGSLGILSEALHSGLDLVAAAITYFAVRVSDKPADKEHPYGHGKFENFSAFIETILLVVTCVWIIYEASHRLITGKVEIEVTKWSYIVVIFSIVADYWRSTQLKKAAIKHNSQALEADALHFSTDIWSSCVVLIGLIGAQFGYYYADSISALGVALIVLSVSYRLGKRASDVLLDRTSRELTEKVEGILKGITGVQRFHDVKVRSSGANTFVELNIHVHPKITIEQAHTIAEDVETQICSQIDRCTVHVHQEPDE